MAQTGPDIVSNDTAAKFANSPQKTGEPLDHATLFSGKALEFDGVADYLRADATQTSELGIASDDITVSGWTKVDVDSGSYPIVFGWEWFSNNGIGVRYDSVNTKFSAYVGDDTTLKLMDFTTFALDTWYYFVVTYNTSDKKGRFYIDGKLHATSSALSTSALGWYVHSTNADFHIGKQAVYGYYYPGKITNVQAWNKKWELSDVQYAYENPEKLITDNASVTDGITTTNLKLWYPMNDTGVRSPQTVVFDAAGTNNTTKNHATTTFLGDEMLTNTGFETLKSGESGNTAGTVTDLFDDWTVSLGGSSTVEADTDVSPQAGTYAAKMLYNGGQSYIYQDVTVVNGRNYTLSFYI